HTAEVAAAKATTEVPASKSAAARIRVACQTENAEGKAYCQRQGRATTHDVSSGRNPVAAADPASCDLLTRQGMTRGSARPADLRLGQTKPSRGRGKYSRGDNPAAGVAAAPGGAEPEPIRHG